MFCFIYIWQAVVSPFSNGGSPTPDQTETRFTYFPATATPEAAAVTSQQPEVTTASAIGSITTGIYCISTNFVHMENAKIFFNKLTKEL